MQCSDEILSGLAFTVLLLIESLYIHLARRFGFGMRNGAHDPVTGAGIIFIISLWMFAIFTAPELLPENFGYIVGSATALAVISFIDDMHPVSPLIRLCIQAATITIPLLTVPEIQIYWVVYIGIILIGVAFVNAYNFMDGINGMTAAYSIVTLISIGYFSKIALQLPNVVNGLSVVMISATAAFGFFNFRHREIAHCGDTGSIVMGFLIFYLISSLIYATGDWSYISIVYVYGIDTVYTVIYRMLHGNNILKGHRLHLYQLLDIRKHVPHLYISSAYAAVQLVINVGLLVTPPTYRMWYAEGTLVILVALYAAIHHRIMRSATSSAYTAAATEPGI